MSLPFLRPLGFGEILDGGFSLYRRHFPVLFATALIAMLPVSVVSGAWLHMMQGGGPAGDAPLAIVGGALVFGLVALVCYSVIFGALVRQVGGAVSGGEVSIADGCLHALRRFVPIAVALVLSSLAIMAAIFVVVVPLVVVIALVAVAMAMAGGAPPGPAMPIAGGVLTAVAIFVTMFLLMTGFFAVTPAVVLESRGPVAALGRSWRLASGARVRILGVLLVSWIIIMLPAVGIAMLTGAGFDAQGIGPTGAGQVAMQQALSLLSSALTLPFFVACTTLLYFDRRVRTEAYDLEAAADALAAGG